MRSVLDVHWKDWCWSWSSDTLATSCKELTHWKRLWCWERLRAGGEGDNRGWDGWMASPTQWTWVWVDSRSWWRTERPGVLWFIGSQSVRHDWATELNWPELNHFAVYLKLTQHCKSILLQLKKMHICYLYILYRHFKKGMFGFYPCLICWLAFPRWLQWEDPIWVGMVSHASHLGP